MWRFLVFGALLSLTSAGFSGSAGTCKKADDNARISPAQTKQVLCQIVENPILNREVDEWVNLALSGVMGLSKQDVFVTYLDLCPEKDSPIQFGQVNGDQPQVASGVIQPFVAAALFNKEGSSLPSDLSDDVKRMLRYGDFEATNHLIDFVTDTQSGPEVDSAELAELKAKRGTINRFLTGLGYDNFNVSQKLMDSAPTGSDLQLLGEKLPMNFKNSNRLATNQVATFLCLLAQNAVVSAKASSAIVKDMQRQVEQEKVAPLAGIVAGLPVGSEIASVNGFTYENFNDAAIVKLPNCRMYILVVFTRYGHSPTVFIPQLSKIIAGRQMTKTGSEESAPWLVGRPLAGNN